MSNLVRLSALMLIAVSVVAGPAAAAPLKLASYRAVYDLTLGKSQSSSGIADIDGRLVLEWQDVCDGYVFGQRIRTEMLLFQGGTTSSDYTVSSWESRDGLRFRFSLKHLINDEVVETYQGQAKLDGRGKGGTVVYTEPAGKRDKLPAGVIFPTEHNIVLLRKGRAGESLAIVDVFDGSGDEGLNRATAFIGKARAAEKSDKPAYKPLRGLASWPVRLAYHRLEGDEGVPAYEVGFRLYENGVPGDVLLVYDDFSIAGALTGLEILPEPTC